MLQLESGMTALHPPPPPPTPPPPTPTPPPPPLIWHDDFISPWRVSIASDLNPSFRYAFLNCLWFCYFWTKPYIFSPQRSQKLKFYVQIYKVCVRGIYWVHRFHKPNIWRVYITRRYKYPLTRYLSSSQGPWYRHGETYDVTMVMAWKCFPHHITGLCEGKSRVTGGLPSQMANHVDI